MSVHSSPIEIAYDGDAITNHVKYADAQFSLNAGAMPGTVEITIVDRQQEMSFQTGRELTLTVDEVPLWGGYILSVAQKFALPVVDTRNPSAVTQRLWVLRGVDYNILFDKRFMRDPSNYLALFPGFPKTRYDGDLIRNDLCPLYLDIPAGFNTEDHVDDVVPPFDPLLLSRPGEGAWMQPGTSWRAQMEDFAQFSGAVFYLSAGKYLEYHALETVLAPWGFSDMPDGTDFIGFRELDLVEDGSAIVNDAMIWGGSQYAGEGQTVFAREQNVPSQESHQRWQHAETHFGETGYMLQDGVDVRAQVIVNGAPGSVGGDAARGLRFAQWQITLSWFAKDVPGRAHLKPGDIVTFNFWAMSADGGVTPFTQVLPLRSLSIGFENLDDTGKPYVKFTGSFGLQATDPYSVWNFLRHALHKIEKTPAVLATADGTSIRATYGTLFSGAPDGVPDGTTVEFALPNGFGYIPGTTQVYKDGLLLIPGGVDYEEVDPLGGLISFSAAPDSSDNLWIRCYLT